MNTVTACLAEVRKIDADLEALARIADLDTLADIDTALGLLNRAARLLLRVELLAGHGGAGTEYLNDVRRAALAYLDAQIELSDRRTALEVEQAAWSTKH